MMMSKKLITSGGIVLGISLMTLTPILANALSGETIKPNVVYTKSPSVETPKVTKAESNLEKKYKFLFQQALKAYFDVELNFEGNGSYTAYIESIESIPKYLDEELDYINKSFKEGTMTQKDVDKYKKRALMMTEYHLERAKRLGNDQYMCHWSENASNPDNPIIYEATFDAATQKPLSFHIPYVSYTGLEALEKTSAAENEKRAKTGLPYIKKHQLGDIREPEVLKIYGKNVFYQDAQDHSKKVCLYFDPNNGKIAGFEVGIMADMSYEVYLKE